ncbi:MAG: tetratricopeptide repeat-containing serine/threonine-protein kinase [Planctomycetales bacterium]|nr:tetratricopeptide repeat-containing serine/threonine-protein kinase [Planctomycetales bacterium]
MALPPPARIALDEGAARAPGWNLRSAFLADFGLAKSTATGSRLTRSGQALGTPAYMSPEQARGEVSALTPATDVWSLGCVLHEMLASRPPWEGDSTAAVIAGILTREPTPVRELRPDVPAALERILRVALAKRPRTRFAEAKSFRDDLDRVLAGRRPRARLPWSRLRWGVALAGLAAAAALGLGPRAIPIRTEAAVPASVPEPSPAERLVARARARRGADPREAAGLLAEALEREPGRHAWRLERGLLLWAIGQGAEAVLEWGRIPPDAPEGAAGRLYLGLEAFFRLDGAEARPHLEALQPGSGRESGLARAAFAAGLRDWRTARLDLREATGWEAALLRGYVEGLDPDGDPAAGVRHYDQALREGIPFAWALANRGDLHRRIGETAGALADFDAALRLKPDFAEALNNRGIARDDAGDTRGAEEDFAAAMRASADFTAPWLNRGLLRARLGDLAGSVADLTEYLRRHPGDAAALVGRGQAFLRLGDVRPAERDLGEAILSLPGDWRLRYLRGNARGALGDYPGALEDYSESLRLRPGHALSWSQRGDVRRQLGDPAGAVGDYSEAIRLAPEVADTWALRASAREAVGDLQEAADDGREALRRKPDLPEVRALLARCEQKLREE